MTYTEKGLKKCIQKAFGKGAFNTTVFLNGHRAEGWSFIFAEEAHSIHVEKLMEIINQEYPDMPKLYRWRARIGTRYSILNEKIPFDVRKDCIEVRVIHGI